MSGNSQEVSRDLSAGTEQKLGERKNDVFISFLPSTFCPHFCSEGSKICLSMSCFHFFMRRRIERCDLKCHNLVNVVF